MSYKSDYDILREFINESLDTNEVRIDEKIKTAVRAVGGENQFTYKSDWGKSFGGQRGKTGLPQSVEKLPGSVWKFGKSVLAVPGAVSAFTGSYAEKDRREREARAAARPAGSKKCPPAASEVEKYMNSLSDEDHRELRTWSQSDLKLWVDDALGCD